MTIKKILKDFIFYGINGVIGKILALVTLPIITSIFTPGDYGIIETITSSIALLPLLLGLGYDMSIKKMVLVDAGKDTQKISNIVSTIFWFLIVWGGFLTVILFFLSTPISILIFKSSQYHYTVRMAFINIYISLLFGFELTMLRVYFKSKQYTVINTCNTILTYLLIILFIARFKLGISGYFYAMMISGLVISLVTFLLIRKDIKFYFSFAILKSVLGFGIPVLTASLAYWIFNLSDRLILTRLANPTETGLYSMAIKITSIVPFIVMAFREAWVPRAYQMYHENNETFPVLLNKVHQYVLIAFGILGMANMVVAKLLLNVLSTESFYQSYILIAPLIYANILFPLTYVGSIGIYLSNKPKYISYMSWVSAILNLGLNVLLVPVIGALSASITTAISYFVLYVTYWYYTSKLMNWKLSFTKPLITLCILASFFVLTQFISYDNIILDVLVKIAIFALYIVVLFALRLCSFADIKKLLRKGEIGNEHQDT